MRYERFLLLASVGLIGGCSDSTGLDPDIPPQTETFEWSGEVAPAGRVEIKNTQGDVRARPSSDGKVRVYALKEGENDDPSTVRIEVVETPQGVTVCALYPDVPGRPANQCLPGMAGQRSSRDNDVTVTFDIQIPAGRAFSGGTIAGSVEAADLSGHVNARAVAGNIEVSTSGTAEATAINGNITASIGAGGWDRDLSFRTVSGHVTIRVPAHTNADVWGSTGGGSVSTDFPLSVTRVGAWQQLRGRLGHGGWNLHITTGAGDLALLAK